jgi:hypothetical protein
MRLNLTFCLPFPFSSASLALHELFQPRCPAFPSSPTHPGRPPPPRTSPPPHPQSSHPQRKNGSRRRHPAPRRRSPLGNQTPRLGMTTTMTNQNQLQFGTCPHRCLFRNHCVEAHLLGLTGDDANFSACLPSDLTLIVTYGHVAARVGTCLRQLQEGDQLEVPPSCPFQLSAQDAADVILVVS